MTGCRWYNTTPRYESGNKQWEMTDCSARWVYVTFYLVMGFLLEEQKRIVTSPDGKLQKYNEKINSNILILQNYFNSSKRMCCIHEPQVIR